MATYEPGRYRLKVLNQGFSESKTKGTPFFFLECEPVAQLEGDNAYQVENTYPRTISLYITDKTADNVADKLKALGWVGGRWGSLDPNKPSFHSFIGTEIEAVCKHEPGINGDGKLYEKWDLPWGGDYEPTISNPTIASKLDSLFGKAAKPSPAAKKPAAKPATAGVHSNGTEDEIPF